VATEIGRVVLARGGVALTLAADGTWAGPPGAAELLGAVAGPDLNRPSAGPWGWPQLDRAAELLGGTAVPRRLAGADPLARDAQAPLPEAAAAFATTPVPRGAVKVEVPGLDQDDDYSCGAVCLAAAARYFDVGPGPADGDPREWFKARLGTTARDGTPPGRLESLARELGLAVEVGRPMSPGRLRAALDAGRPVVCAIQAWGDPAGYPAAESGHYVLAVGYDSEHVYFDDPMVRQARGYMGWNQFVARWHDVDAAGTPYRRWGMALWRADAPAVEIP
jgi:hypothetical protein